MSSAGSWWCHQCNMTIGQPRSASRPVCPHCDGGFVEEVKNGNHGAKWFQAFMDMSITELMDMTKDIAKAEAEAQAQAQAQAEAEAQAQAEALYPFRLYPFRFLGKFVAEAEAEAEAFAKAKAKAKAFALAKAEAQAKDPALGLEILMARAMAKGGHGRDIRAIPAMAQGSEARDISGRSLISPSSRPEDLVHEDEFPRRKRSRGENMLTCSLHSVPEELLQVSVQTPPPSRASVEVRGKDVAAQCAMCKGEFKRRKYARRTSCSHMYHTDCILQSLAQHNSCPACRYKKSTDDPEYDRMHSCGRNDTSSSGTMGISGARFDSHGPVSSYFSPPHGHEHDDECLPEDRSRMMRRNMGECSLGPRVEQLLQEPVESDPGSRGPPLAWRALGDSLVELKVRGKDVAAQCARCKGEFEIGKYAKRMPCSHMYHANCILQWLAQHNSCPACGYKMKTDDPEYGRMHSRGRNETSFSGGRSRFSHIRPFRACSGSAGSGKTVSSFFHDTQGNNFGLDDDGDVIMQECNGVTLRSSVSFA